MESKNIIIICTWVFLITLWILSYLGGWDLFWPLMLSFGILVISIGMSFTPESTQSNPKLTEEIQNLKSKVDTTAKDIEEIKRIIKE